MTITRSPFCGGLASSSRTAAGVRMAAGRAGNELRITKCGSLATREAGHCTTEGAIRPWDGLPAGHCPLDFVGGAGEAGGQLHQPAVLIHVEHILDAHAKLLFRDVDSRLQREDHALVQFAAGLAGIVDVESDVMAQAVDEVAAEGIALAVLAVGVDVVVGDLVEEASPSRPSVDFPAWNAWMAACCAPSTMS